MTTIHTNPLLVLGPQVNGDGVYGSPALSDPSYLQTPSPDSSEESRSRRGSNASVTSQETVFEAEVARALKVFFKGTKDVHKGLDDVKKLSKLFSPRICGSFHDNIHNLLSFHPFIYPAASYIGIHLYPINLYQ